MSQASHDVGQDSQFGDGERYPEITWVGEQRLMHGYCGRATPPAAVPAAEAQAARPVAAVRRTRPWQGRVVRIGPPQGARGAKAAEIRPAQQQPSRAAAA